MKLFYIQFKLSKKNKLGKKSFSFFFQVLKSKFTIIKIINVLIKIKPILNRFQFHFESKTIHNKSD